MKVIICCEGSTDVGPLTVFMKKCARLNTEIDCRTREDLRRTKVLNTGFCKNILKNNDQITRIISIRKLHFLAVVSGNKHIAFHQDSDNHGVRKIYNDVHNDFNKVLPPEIKRLAIVPKEMIESWLLADVKAINLLSDGSKVNQSPNPESINDPKTYLKRNLAKIGVESNSIIYARIAENTDIDVVKSRCPESFGQFYTDMQSFIQETNP